jgi:hypothetical protein
VLLQAADKAEALAPATAARALGAALRLLSAGDQRWFVIERRLADSLMAAGRPADGHAVLVAALERAPEETRLGLTASIANAETWLGRHDEAPGVGWRSRARRSLRRPRPTEGACCWRSASMPCSVATSPTPPIPLPTRSPTPGVVRPYAHHLRNK